MEPETQRAVQALLDATAMLDAIDARIDEAEEETSDQQPHKRTRMDIKEIRDMREIRDIKEIRDMKDMREKAQQRVDFWQEQVRWLRQRAQPRGLVANLFDAAGALVQAVAAHLQPRQQPVLTAPPTQHQLYRVKGCLKASRIYKGVRRELYEQASLAGACYGCASEELSIRYGDLHDSGQGYRSADLEFELLFDSFGTANRFVGALYNFFYYRGFRTLMEDEKSMTVSATPELFCLSQLQLVNIAHYTKRSQREAAQCDNDLCDSVLSNTTMADVVNDPEAMLQTLEDPDILRMEGLKLYGCRIAAKHDKENSNRLFMSSLFHSYFDGMMTPLQVPFFVIKFIGVGERTAVIENSPVLKTKVEIELEWMKGVDPRGFKARLKPETTKVGEHTWRTFIWVNNAAITEECINIKYRRTTERWAETMTTKSMIHELPHGDADDEDDGDGEL